MIPVPPPEVTQTEDGGYWISIGAGTPNECKTWVSSMHLVDDHIGHLTRAYRLKASAGGTLSELRSSNKQPEGGTLQQVYDQASEVFPLRDSQ